MVHLVIANLVPMLFGKYRCPTCGHVNRKDDAGMPPRVCARCGQALRGGPAGQDDEPPRDPGP